MKKYLLLAALALWSTDAKAVTPYATLNQVIATTGALKSNGSGTVAQAACADLTNAVASCSTDTTNAANISSGVLGSSRGGAGAITGALKANGSGVVSQAACGDLSNGAASCSTDTTNASNIGSGTLPAARLPNPSATTLGGIESLASASHKWINAISTSGVPAATQPACADLSDGATGCSTVVGTAATVNTGTSGGTIPLLNGANTWSGVQTITNSDWALLGSSTGKTTFTSDNAGASNFTLHVPAANDTLVDLAGAQALTNKDMSGAGNTWPTFNQNTTGTANIAGGTVGAVPYQTGANATGVVAATATASKMFLSGASAIPTWSTSTIPTSAGATANKVLLSDGTNYVLSTPTFPNASATSGKYIRSDGINWIASTGSASGTGSCTNQFVTATSSDAAPTCTTATLASAQFANQGTTATVLHGNAAGNPSFAAVSLTAEVSGTLPLGNGGTGQTTATAAFDGLAPCSTQGDIVYYNGTHWVCLAVGSSGQLLSSGGAAANPSWITASGTGTVTSIATTAPISGGTITTTGAISFDFSHANTWTGLQTFNVAPATYYTGSSSETDCVNQNSGTSLALNLDNGNSQCVTITGAVTITITTPTHPVKSTIRLTQDGSGHVYSISGCKWPGGTAITYSTAASKVDIISIFYDGTNSYCMGGAAFS